MGGYPGDKLQIIHPLQLFGFFPIPVADLPLFLIGGKTLKRKQRSDHSVLLA
jgi:hypothetical protein